MRSDKSLNSGRFRRRVISLNGPVQTGDPTLAANFVRLHKHKCRESAHRAASRLIQNDWTMVKVV
jgi:hypothetical protein